MKMEIESVRPPHGQKRPPDNDLEGEQRLTKRFNLLNIGTTKLLIILQRF